MKYLYKSIILAIVAPDTIIGTSEVHPHGAGGGSSSVSVERIGVPFPLNAFRAMCGELNYRLDPDMDLPNRDMIRAYFIGAGYGRRGDGNLLTFDQNCEMLLGGTNSLEYLLFYACVDGNEDAIEAALYAYSSPDISAMDGERAAEAVYNRYFSRVNGFSESWKNHFTGRFMAERIVAQALFLKFGFRYLDDTKARILIEELTGEHDIDMAKVMAVSQQNLLRIYAHLLEDRSPSDGPAWTYKEKLLNVINNPEWEADVLFTTDHVKYTCLARHGGLHLPPIPKGLGLVRDDAEDYVTSAGYVAGGALLAADPGCDLLSDGRKSLPYLLFVAAIEGVEDAINSASGEWDAYKEEAERDFVALMVYDKILSSPVAHCVEGHGCGEITKAIGAGSSVLVALFLKFAFTVLDKSQAARVFQAVTGVNSISDDTVRALRGLVHRDLMMIHAQLRYDEDDEQGRAVGSDCWSQPVGAEILRRERIIQVVTHPWG